MRKSILATGLLALFCAGALPARAQTHPAQVGVAVGEPGNQTGPNFVKTLMMADKYAIAAGKLAENKARDPAVREVAHDMVADHRKKVKALKKIYDRTLVGKTPTPPPGLRPAASAPLSRAARQRGRFRSRVYRPAGGRSPEGAGFRRRLCRQRRQPETARLCAEEEAGDLRSPCQIAGALSGQTLAQNGPAAR